MKSLWSNLRYALRQLLTYPIESALVVIALAVGVGALSAVAALYGVNDEIARRLRADLISRQFIIAPATTDSLASLSEERLLAPLRENQVADLRFSLEDIDELRELAPSLDHVYFVTAQTFYPQKVNPATTTPLVDVISADYTRAANIEVARGSWFSEADFAEGRRVLVIVEGYADTLGIEGDPLGQEIPMNYANAGGAPFTVIGILPEDHMPPTSGGLVVGGYIPYSPTSSTRPNRIRAAVDDPRKIPQASEELRLSIDRIWSGQAVAQPPSSLWQATTAERNRALLLAGFASVGLLMASLNITNLMLARVRRREKSIAILRSLGASKASVRSQVLVEAGMLGFIGGLIGVLLSQVLLRALVATSAPGLVEILREMSFPPSAVLVTLTASVLVTIIIGLVPATRAAATTIVPGAASTADLATSLPKPLRRNPARLALTALQLMLSGAAIVVGLHVLTVGNATKPELELFTLDAVNDDHVNPGWFTVFTERQVEPLLALAPSASALTSWDVAFAPGVVVMPEQEYMISGIRQAGPDYLSLVGAKVIAGNALSGSIDARAQDEILLEESVAAQLYTSSEAAVGQQLTIRRLHHSVRDPTSLQTFTIAGVYEYDDERNAFGTPERVAAISNPSREGSFYMLAAAAPGNADEAKTQLVSAARTVLGNTFSKPLFGTENLDFVTNDLHDQAQLLSTLNQAVFIFTLMAITALILAAVGIFSLSILNTAERTRDIGVRRALGASKGQIAREIAGSAIAIAAVATVIGVAGAWVASPSLSKALSGSLLSGIGVPLSPSLALLTLGIVLVLSGLLGWIVGFRATGANPSTILSEESV